MTTKTEYKVKMESEIAELEAKLASIKEEAKIKAAATAAKYDEATHDMQQQIEVAKGKLAEVGDAAEDAWDKMKDGMEHSWVSVKNMFSAAVDKIKS